MREVLAWRQRDCQTSKELRDCGNAKQHRTAIPTSYTAQDDRWRRVNIDKVAGSTAFTLHGLAWSRGPQRTKELRVLQEYDWLLHLDNSEVRSKPEDYRPLQCWNRKDGNNNRTGSLNSQYLGPEELRNRWPWVVSVFYCSSPKRAEVPLSADPKSIRVFVHILRLLL